MESPGSPGKPDKAADDEENHQDGDQKAGVHLLLLPVFFVLPLPACFACAFLAFLSRRLSCLVYVTGFPPIPDLPPSTVLLLLRLALSRHDTFPRLPIEKSES